MTLPDALPDAQTASIIVVNFNGGAKLRACIDAMRRTAPKAELVVIDNASTDGSANALSDVRLVRNAVNCGYAAALAQGARLTSGRVLVFFNMDTIPEDGWLEPLVALLEERADAGAVNPLILLADGERVNAAGQRFHVTGLGFNSALGARVADFGTEPFEVSGIQGAAFAMRREVFDAIGGLDEAGFLYHEDVNLSWLLRLAGYRLFCVPRSRVRHDYFLSMYAEKFCLLERNRVAMLLAYMKLPTRLLLAPLLLLTEVLAWGYAILRRHGFVSAKWRSYRWIAAHRDHIAARRRVVKRLRRVGDLALLRTLAWSYEWTQFGVLARETGRGKRQPDDVAALRSHH